MDVTKEFVDNPPFVGLLQFETNTVCDGACTFCNHRVMKRKATASWSTLLEVIDTCAPYAMETCPFLMQEPCLEPRLVKILDNLKQVNPHIKTHIYSNMHSMTPKVARQILDSQLLDELTVSFYGPTPELYKKYQPTFSFERTRANIKYFIDYRNRHGFKKPRVNMHFIALPDLLRYYEAFKVEWKDYADSIGCTIYRTHTENEVAETEGWMHKIYGAHSKRVPCIRVWTGFYVLSNGDVVPCSADYEGDNVLGNIHDCYHPLDIWWGAKAKAFRQKHIDGKYDEIPMCKNCNYWKYEMPKEWVNYWLNYYGGKNICQQTTIQKNI